MATVLFGAAALFFTYYTVRLVYVNLTSADAARHRQGGMLLGAVTFPIAVAVFGYLTVKLARWTARRSELSEKGFTAPVRVPDLMRSGRS